MIFFKKNKPSIGELGEKIAAKYLKKKGYKILEKNFTNTQGRRLGEIDIIARKNKEIVFVEVKSKETKENQNVLPEEKINKSKLHKLEKISAVYIKNNDLWKSSYRFDGISVWISANRKDYKIKHMQNIFI